jgi:hypothetical protein
MIPAAWELLAHSWPVHDSTSLCSTMMRNATNGACDKSIGCDRKKEFLRSSTKIGALGLRIIWEAFLHSSDHAVAFRSEYFLGLQSTQFIIHAKYL